MNKSLYLKLSFALADFEQNEKAIASFTEEKKKRIMYLLNNRYDLRFNYSHYLIIKCCQLAISVLKTFESLKEDEEHFIYQVLRMLADYKILHTKILNLTSDKETDYG